MKRLLGLLAIIIFIAGCISSIVASTLYQYDRANSDAPVTEEVPEGLNKIDITDGEGIRTYGWYYEYDKNAPVVMYYHGNASNIQSALNSGFIDKLKTLKINFAIFDYPKYGLSTGEPNEKSVIAASQGVYDFLKQKFPTNHFVIWGRSLGCAPATIMARLNHAGVSKLILTTPWDSFWKMIQIKSNLSEKQARKAARGNEYESEIHAKEISMPVLIHHGTKDTVVPWELGKNLSESFASNDVTFVTIDGADHDNLLGNNEWDEISHFIRY